MVWSVLDSRELTEIIKRMNVEKNNRPQPNSLAEMIAFVCQGYSHSRILTFQDVDQGFIDKLPKDNTDGLFKEMMRLGWVVERRSNNQVKEGAVDSAPLTHANQRQRHQKHPNIHENAKQ